MDDALCLKFPVSLRQGNKSLSLDDGEFIHRFKNIPEKAFSGALIDFETPTPPGLVIERYPEANSDVSEFVRYCEAYGILQKSSSPLQTISGPMFAGYLQVCFRAINEEMFTHTLWEKLADGKAGTALVNGWLIETYFFIKGANARLPNAIAYCKHDGLRSALLHHYLEEWDHYGFFRQAMELRGLDAGRLESRGPLPATKAVMLMARKAGRENSLGYLACSGLLESTGSDAKKAREFYGAIRHHYDLDASNFVAPMLKHIDLDEEYEHGDLMAEALEKFEVISRKEADAVINILHGFKETLIQWFDEINEYYSRDVDVYGLPVSGSFLGGVFK